MIKLGNIYYFLYMAISIFLIIFTILITSKQNKKTQKIIIFCILMSGFILHFLKLLNKQYYEDLPYSLRKVSFENICAVSTLIFPFIFLFGNDKWKDYMYCFGIFGGVGMIINPNPAIGYSIFAFEAIRCYYCHLVLVISAILMVKCGFHKLDYHRLWKMPITFFEVLVIILFNEVILMATGLVKPDIMAFFDRSYRNSSFIFGPTPSFDWLKPVIDFFVPSLFRTIPFGSLKGQELYWPIIWMVIPGYILLYILGVGIYLPFEKEHMKSDFKIFKEKFIQNNSN